MKRERFGIVARILLVCIGVTILIYPSLSEYLSEKNSSTAIVTYDDSVAKANEKMLDEILARAREYNKELAYESGYGKPVVNSFGEPVSLVGYDELLNLDGDGMMGYINIPCLNVTVPIYHTTNESVLQVGIGHLENTSLPVGGELSHSVLSGHTGLPTKSLFTDLDQMKIGDRFFIKVLNETLCYTVDEINVVLPYETEKLAIVEGEDYCTLITCTPYGINDHRLLVRGKRTEYNPETIKEEMASETDNLSIWMRMPMQYRHFITGALVIVLLVAIKLLIMVIKRLLRK